MYKSKYCTPRIIRERDGYETLESKDFSAVLFEQQSSINVLAIVLFSVNNFIIRVNFDYVDKPDQSRKKGLV